jgi:hypothetical protein
MTLQKRKFVHVLNSLNTMSLRHMGVWSIISPFLTSALDGGEWSASCSGCFTSREIDPDTYWIGGWLDPRAGLEAVE